MGVMQSLIKISANFASESMYRDIYKGMAAAQKVGRQMGKAFEKGFNSTSTSRMPTPKNFTLREHKLLQNSVQKRLAGNLQDIDSIINKTLLGSFSGRKMTRTNNALSKMAEITALNNYSLKEFISSPGAMRNAMGRSSALDVLRVLDRSTFPGYDSIVSNSVKEMREMNRFVVQDKIKNSFKNPSGYKPSIATVGGINAGNPVLNRGAGYAIGGFFGSPTGMALSMGALGMYTANQGIQTLANYDTMFRQTAAYMGGKDAWKEFNDLLRDPLENVAYEYAIQIRELNNYVLEAIKSGFDPKNIASSLEDVGAIKRIFNLSVPALTELIVMGSNQGWLDPSDGESIQKYLAQLVTMVTNTKGSLNDFSNTLGYSQPILNAPGMTDTDYINIMGVLSNSNIKGTRAGRSMGRFFQRLFVPDSSADAIEKVIISSMQKDGYKVDSKDMKKLSDYFASLGWSIYDKKGEIQIGEGKRYANYTEALVNLFEKLEKANFTDAMAKSMGGEFGQIAQRVFEHFKENYGDLTTLRAELVASKENAGPIMEKLKEMSLSGIGHARSKFSSALEQLALTALELEESFGGLESSLEGIIWLFSKISALGGWVAEGKGKVDEKTALRNNAIKIVKAAEMLGIDLKTASPEEKRRAFDRSLKLSDIGWWDNQSGWGPDLDIAYDLLHSIGFLANALEQGKPLQDSEALEHYVENTLTTPNLDFLNGLDSLKNPNFGLNTPITQLTPSYELSMNNGKLEVQTNITITNKSGYPVEGEVDKDNPITRPYRAIKEGD